MYGGDVSWGLCPCDRKPYDQNVSPNWDRTVYWSVLVAAIASMKALDFTSHRGTLNSSDAGCLPWGESAFSNLSDAVGCATSGSLGCGYGDSE